MKFIKVQKKETTTKPQNKMKKHHLPQILGWGFELLIQNSETAWKSQSMHLMWQVQENVELTSALIRDYQRGSAELSL